MTADMAIKHVPDDSSESAESFVLHSSPTIEDFYKLIAFVSKKSEIFSGSQHRNKNGRKTKKKYEKFDTFHMCNDLAFR